MKKEQWLKLVGYFVLVMMILNLVLFAFRVTNVVVFWAIIIIGALFVWKGLPWLKKI